MSCQDAQWYQERIDAIKARIIAHEEAAEAAAALGVQQYTLDTGQSRQNVQKYDVDKVEDILAGLQNRLDAYCARLHGGVTIQRAAW